MCEGDCGEGEYLFISTERRQGVKTLLLFYGIMKDIKASVIVKEFLNTNQVLLTLYISLIYNECIRLMH